MGTVNGPTDGQVIHYLQTAIEVERMKLVRQHPKEHKHKKDCWICRLRDHLGEISEGRAPLLSPEYEDLKAHVTTLMWDVRTGDITTLADVEARLAQLVEG